MDVLTIIAIVVALAGYTCLSMRIAFELSFLIESSFFGFSLFFMTACGLLSLPFVIAFEVAK